MDAATQLLLAEGNSQLTGKALETLAIGLLAEEVATVERFRTEIPKRRLRTVNYLIGRRLKRSERKAHPQQTRDLITRLLLEASAKQPGDP